MHCSEFREHHCAFVDDTLAGVELVRMQGHIAECPPCAELDARVRRSLMLARSIPLIEPSADFRRRLDAKLQACRDERLHEATSSHFRAVAAIGAVASLLMMGYVMESLHTTSGHVAGRMVARDVVLSPVVAMAQLPETPAVTSTTPKVSTMHTASSAGNVAVASSAGVRHRDGRPPAEIVSGSGRGVVPVSGNEPVAPEIIASVSAGMPLWPAALFAEQAPLHYANVRKPVH